MIAAIVRPLIACAVLAGLALLGARAETYNVNPVFYCVYGIARDDRPAADILFVGNSQTGAAIDAVYLEQLLHDAGAPRVEKLAIVRASVVSIRMIVDEYVEHRGAPRLVVVQPMVSRAVNDMESLGHPVHSRENLGFQDFAALKAVETGAVRDAGKSRLPIWAAKGDRSIAALWLDKQAENIIAALSFARLKPFHRLCETDEKFTIAGNWPYGTLPLAPGDDNGPTPDKEEREAWIEQMALRSDADVEHPSRRFEIDQTRQMLSRLDRAGSRIVLVGFPTLGRGEKDKLENAAFAKVLGYEMVDVREELPEADREKLDDLHRDPVHVNFAGSQIITEFMAKDLSGRIVE